MTRKICIPELILELPEPATSRQHLSKMLDTILEAYSLGMAERFNTRPLIPFEYAAIKTFLMNLALGMERCEHVCDHGVRCELIDGHSRDHDYELHDCGSLDLPPPDMTS